MTCYAILAVRPVDQGKSRLSDSLSNDERISLNYRMFRHVFSTMKEVFPAGRIIVISRSGTLLEEARMGGAFGQQEEAGELNSALSQGARFAVDRGASALLNVSSDLPFLETRDILAMLAAAGDIVIATDRTHSGTNALLVRRPFAIPYRYGLGSLAAHLAAAREAGLTATVIDRPGLARDIDTPADLAELSEG